MALTSPGGVDVPVEPGGLLGVSSLPLAWG